MIQLTEAKSSAKLAFQSRGFDEEDWVGNDATVPAEGELNKVGPRPGVVPIPGRRQDGQPSPSPRPDAGVGGRSPKPSPWSKWKKRLEVLKTIAEILGIGLAGIWALFIYGHDRADKDLRREPYAYFLATMTVETSEVPVPVPVAVQHATSPAHSRRHSDVIPERNRKTIEAPQAMTAVHMRVRLKDTSKRLVEPFYISWRLLDMASASVPVSPDTKFLFFRNTTDIERIQPDDEVETAMLALIPTQRAPIVAQVRIFQRSITEGENCIFEPNSPVHSDNIGMQTKIVPNIICIADPDRPDKCRADDKGCEYQTVEQLVTFSPAEPDGNPKNPKKQP